MATESPLLIDRWPGRLKSAGLHNIQVCRISTNSTVVEHDELT